MNLWCLLYLFILIQLSTAEEDCSQSGVCICSLSHCASPLIPLSSSDLIKGQGVLYTTSIDEDRLRKTPIKIHFDKKKTKKLNNHANETKTVRLNIYSNKYSQSIIGFGGAITDAASINIDLLPKELSDLLMKSYFGEEGIGYNLIRIPIASCDFSIREYSYADKYGDFSLSTFALAPEDKLKLKWSRKAIELTKKEGKDEMKIFGSPWSAPAWMKTNGHMKGGGDLKNQTRYIKSYANYITRFIESYVSEGVPIWGITTQNEPSTGTDKDYSFQTMSMPPELQSRFVRDYLKPSLKKSSMASNVSIMIHDDFRGNLPDWPDKVLSDPTVNGIVDGIAVHWYGDRWDDPNRLTLTKERHPKQFILSTEACVTDTHGVSLGNFTRGMMYAHDIIEDLSHSVSGWVDWNIALDLQGGPNWVQNFVDAPIIIDSEKKEFYKQPMYYAMGQFSRFIRPGAIVINHTVVGEANGLISAVAVKNVDKTTVTVIINRYPHDVQVEISDHTISTKVTLKTQSINTIIYQ